MRVCSDVNGNGPLESTLRSYRALALQLLRRTVTPENRSDAVRGVICMTYGVSHHARICLPPPPSPCFSLMAPCSATVALPAQPTALQERTAQPRLFAAQIEICLWVVITVALPAMVSDPRLPFFHDAQTGVVLAAGTFGSVVSHSCSQ